MWTGMMAAVRSVMAASILLASIWNVSGVHVHEHRQGEVHHDRR